MTVGTRAGVAYVDVKLGNLSGLTRQMTAGVDAAAKAAAAKAGQEISKGIRAGAAGIGGIKGPKIDTSSVTRLKRSLSEAAAAGRQLGKDLGVVGQQIVGVGRKAAGLGQAFIRPLRPVGAAIRNNLLKPLASIASSVGTRISGMARGLGNALATPFRAAGNAARAFASEVRGRFSSAVANAGARMKLAGSTAAQFGGRIRNMWTVAKQTSPVLGALTGAAGRFGGALRGSLTPMGNVIKSSGRLGASLGRVGGALGGVARQAGGVVLSGLRRVGSTIGGLAARASSFAGSFRGTMSNVGSQLNNFSRRLGLTGFMIQNLGHTMTLAFTAPVAAIAALTFKLGGGLVNTMQNAEISFEAFTGSAKTASTMIQRLRKYATDSPIFDTQSAITYAKQLMGVGVQMKDLFPSLNTIQYLTAKYGLTADETNGIVLAWTQVLSKGKAYSEELTQQMSEHGIPIWGILAKAFGVSQAKMHEMVKDGQVDAKAFQKAMVKVGQAGDFDKVITKKANTFQGVWDRMKESISNSLADAILSNQKPIREFLDNFSKAVKIMASNAGPFVRGLASAFGWLGKALEAAANWFDKLPNSMKQTIANIVLLLAAAGPLVIALGSMLGAVAGIATGLSALATVLGAVTLPMVAIAAAVALVVVGFAAMYTASASFRDIVNSLIGTIVGLYRALYGTALKVAGEGFGKLADAAGRLWHVLDTQLFPAIASIIKDVRDKLTPIWQKIGAVVGKVVSWAFARLADFVQKVLIPVVHFLTQQFKEHHDTIVKIISVVGILVGVLVGVLVGAIVLLAAVFIGTLVAAMVIVTAVVAGLIWFFGTAIPAAFNWCKSVVLAVGAWFAGPFVQFFVNAGKAIAAPFLWLYHHIIIPVWNGIKLAVRVAGFVIMSILLIVRAYIIAWGKIWLWVYNHLIKPALNAVKRGINWLWVNILYPAFNAIKRGWRLLGQLFLWVWNHIIKVAFNAVKNGINWLWVKILYPAFNAIRRGWHTLGNGVRWVWQHIIKPAWNAVKNGINWLWVKILYPAFNAIRRGWHTLGNGIRWVWNHIIKPAWNAVKNGINWLWVKILNPAFKAIRAGWHSVGNGVRWVWQHIIKPAWNAVKNGINWLWVKILAPAFRAIRSGWHTLGNGIRWVWNHIIKPAWNAVKNGIRWLWAKVLAPAFRAIRNGWNLVGNAIRRVWNNVIKPAWHAVQHAAFVLRDKIRDAFNGAKNAVQRIWGQIKSLVKKPVVAVIKFVKDGVLGSIKSAAGKFGFDGIKKSMGKAQGALQGIIAKVNGFATGGHVRGPGGPTGDKIPAWLSNGEYVVRAAAVRKLGVPYLNRLNQADKMRVPNTDAMYASGGPVWKDGLPAFRNGNYVPNLITAIARRMQSGVHMTSGYRSYQTEGHADYHNAGKAADLVSPNMNRLAASFYQVPSYLLELIHTRANSMSGWYVKNGKKVPGSFYGAATQAGHRDHVHVAMTAASAEALLKRLGASGGLLSRIKRYAGTLAGLASGQTAIDWVTDVYDKYFKGPAKTLAGFSKRNGVFGDFLGQTGHMLWDKTMSWFKDKIASISGFGGDGAPYAKGIPTKGTLSAWIRKAMKLTHVDGKPGWFAKLYSIAMRESRGNPRAVNDYDINAKIGDPTKGVMQIRSSYIKKFHQPGTSYNLFDPIANIAAAINYIKYRYKTPFNTPATYYDNGGWLQPGAAAINATNKPELALNESQGRALERRIAGTDQPIVVNVSTPAVAMDAGQFTAVMTRVANQRRYHRPN